MSTNHTPNYSLCQWEAEDKVLRTEFNADNAKIDQAIKAVDQRVTNLSGSTASSSELNSLKSTVDSLSQTLSQHTSALAGKGNCQIYTTSYTGKGTYGEGNPCSVRFPKKPMVVFITGPSGIQGIFSYGEPVYNVGRFGVGGNYINLTWSGNNLSWYATTNAEGQMNSSGKKYSIIGLLQAD